jgi:hypothetical protein
MVIYPLLTSLPIIHLESAAPLIQHNGMIALHCSSALQVLISSYVEAPLAIYPDADPRNADWPKRKWDLPPYKSNEFMEYLHATNRSVSHFRKTPVSLFAVESGLSVYYKCNGFY